MEHVVDIPLSSSHIASQKPNLIQRPTTWSRSLARAAGPVLLKT
jgi:hypothetical protein